MAKCCVCPKYGEKKAEDGREYCEEHYGNRWITGRCSRCASIEKVAQDNQGGYYCFDCYHNCSN